MTIINLFNIFTNINPKNFLVFSEEEPDLNSELEISVRIIKGESLLKKLII